MKNPIWLLSGFLGNENQWGDFTQSLALNSGLTPEVLPWQKICQGAGSLEEAAHFLAQYAYTASVRPILVGYSMGGRLAIQSALSAPGAFSCIVALSAHPGFPDEAERKNRVIEDQEWKTLLLNDFELFWSKWNSRASLKETKAPTKPTLSRIELENWAELLEKLGTGNQNYFPAQFNQGLKVPLIYICGEKDKNFVDYEKLYSPFINTSIEQNCGHRIPLEASESLAKKISYFIQQTRDSL